VTQAVTFGELTKKYGERLANGEPMANGETLGGRNCRAGGSGILPRRACEPTASRAKRGEH